MIFYVALFCMDWYEFEHLLNFRYHLLSPNKTHTIKAPSTSSVKRHYFKAVQMICMSNHTLYYCYYFRSRILCECIKDTPELLKCPHLLALNGTRKTKLLFKKKYNNIDTKAPLANSNLLSAVLWWYNFYFFIMENSCLCSSHHWIALKLSFFLPSI